MRGPVMSYEPCPKCKKNRALGITLIEANDHCIGRSVPPLNPGKHPELYPTGTWSVVRQEAVERWLEGNPMLDDVLTRRNCCSESKAWDELGLPREDINNLKEPA